MEPVTQTTHCHHRFHTWLQHTPGVNPRQRYFFSLSWASGGYCVFCCGHWVTSRPFSVLFLLGVCVCGCIVLYIFKYISAVWATEYSDHSATLLPTRISSVWAPEIIFGRSVLLTAWGLELLQGSLSTFGSRPLTVKRCPSH